MRLVITKAREKTDNNSEVPDKIYQEKLFYCDTTQCQY